MAVIAYQEVPNDLLLEPVAMLRLEEIGVAPQEPPAGRAGGTPSTTLPLSGTRAAN
jgi:hypothetical protein